MQKEDSILITGGSSMLALHLGRYLNSLGYLNVNGTSHQLVDLLDYKQTWDEFNVYSPKYVFNLAGFNGNIAFSQKYQADIFYKTSQIALNCLKAAQEHKVKKCVSILSSCAIADVGDKELEECDLWDGKPNETIEAHGFAKRVWDAYSRQLFKQHGCNYVCAIVNNSFGEYDNTDIDKTKAVMGIIKRVVDAERKGLEEITCWGTGDVYREFIYAGDVAKGLTEVMTEYNNPMIPINVTSRDEISILELTNKIVKLVGYKGKVSWDTTKPDGQKRKSLSKTRMNEFLSIDFTPIDEALQNTIKWYQEQI